jgi:hypothetical protein
MKIFNTPALLVLACSAFYLPVAHSACSSSEIMSGLSRMNYSGDGFWDIGTIKTETICGQQVKAIQVSPDTSGSEEGRPIIERFLNTGVWSGMDSGTAFS